MKISIIIPVYNEEKTLEEIVDRIQKVDLGIIDKEIIIVNDGSKDNSLSIMNELRKKFSNIQIVNHNHNKGKGAAMRTGLKFVTGEIIMWHDADLEYNPKDLQKLIKPILSTKVKVVFGSRLMGHITGFTIPSHYYGNKFLSFITFLLFGQKITDMETGYKMMTKEVTRSIEPKLKANRFNIEPEITATIIKKGYQILEIPIDYNCRSFTDGKKITWKDGFSALYTLIKCRLNRK